ncbi:class III lanthionine synthetase LanKC [Microbacterium sp. W1N]|uniref:class III lanthionine synthetase LanKC n=1 Tax=Microbacterium festucae TaxID=2977531 RepID=UPI0021C1795E|nr:class III lanthionine synthetase LanKC [Microbacterium festucae]MCT9819291.1 class III lanthionine synthetase LanKC [Microbacterium festucae]
MDPIYTAFSAANTVFYDRPGRRGSDSSRPFDVSAKLRAASWRRVDDGHWMHWLPAAAALPDQGWKVHVTTVPSDASDTLELVSAYCAEHRLAFKHVSSAGRLLVSLSKDADRASSGKFITIYPRDESELLDVLTDLDQMIGGRPGPYILSDLRWNDGPLFIRYGAFELQTVIEGGTPVPAIRDRDTGKLVPDIRSTGFHVPPWVRVPLFVELQREHLTDARPNSLPEITGVLHHSNGGGVYVAQLDGRRVVLKEARPHAGWTPDNRDAIARLRDEEAALASLPADVSAPKVLGTYVAHGHRFLAMEYLEGESLATAVVARHPMTRADSSCDDYDAYRDWAIVTVSKLRSQLQALHDSGRTHGDLHPRNVLIDTAGRVSLIDFEMSMATNSSARAVIGVGGFVAPDDRSPAARDEYALACIELFMFVPLTPLLTLSAGKAEELVEYVSEAFRLPSHWADTILARFDLSHSKHSALGIEGGDDHGRPAEDGIVRGLLADATTCRQDRLWPGDPKQFSEAPFSLGSGALGIAAAIVATGTALPPDLRTWIENAILRHADAPLGLINGLAGTVWGGRVIGLRYEERFLARVSNSDWRALDSTLYSGLPGVALTLLACAEFDRSAAGLAADMAQVLQDRLARSPLPDRVATDHGGLLAGSSGTALLALRLYEYFGDDDYLRLAEKAFDIDLATLVETDDGAMHVNEGWRIVPYLGYGSAGIGAVIAQYLVHRPDFDRFGHTLHGITRAASVPFAALAGLTHGRAGLIYYLAELNRRGFGSATTDAAMVHHIRDLRLHALDGGAITRFAGNGLLRASCDLTTGAAGILAARQKRGDAGPLAFLSPLRAGGRAISPASSFDYARR